MGLRLTEYDPNIDAGYLKLSDDVPARAVEKTVLVDITAAGEIVGIEFLDCDGLAKEGD